jgi:GTPase
MCTFAVTISPLWIQKHGGSVRKGMVLVDTKAKPRASWTFCAEIWTIDGQTKILKNNSTPVLHTAHIR